MKEYLRKLPKEISRLIYIASDIASRTGMPAYLVGGFVRDLILGVKNLDLDIVVEGEAIKFAQDFAYRLKAKITCHRQFGTATINLGHNLKIDIATARREYYPQPAHLPVVTPGNLKDDLKRRDFTINAMAISINKAGLGSLIDLFGGREDLSWKKIRILHALSFIDDPTRILRAIRFAKRFNFKIEPQTLKCLKEAIKQKMLEQVQPQRMRDEIILILKEIKPLKAIKGMQALAGFSFINPRLSLANNTYRLLKSIEREISWFRKNYPQRRPLDAWLIYFMGLTGRLNLNDLKLICKRFVFRRGEEKRMFSYKKIGPKFILSLKQKKMKPSKIFALLEPLSYEVVIMIKAKFKHKMFQRRIEDFFEVYNGMKIVISGDDLHRLGIQPGPYYQKIFTQVLNAKVNGRVRTKKEELALIKKLVRPPRRRRGLAELTPVF